MSSAATPASATEYFVGPDGDKSAQGLSRGDPFRTVQEGVRALTAPGDVLTILAGRYDESVTVADKHGTAMHPIRIRADERTAPIIDGSLKRYRSLTKVRWDRVKGSRGEYVSKATFKNDPINRGAFAGRTPYTRLITYTRRQDLRAKNEFFRALRSSSRRPGPIETDAKGRSLGHKRPWVYMGPGLWWNASTHKIHVRLSRTHNGIDGLEDYAGPTDPRRVRLAISAKSQRTLTIKGSDFVRVEGLQIKHGGLATVKLENDTGVSFDHVRIRASSYGVRMGSSTGTTFTNCVFAGGMPPWHFRSDHKAEYHYVANGKVVSNGLGNQTTIALLRGNGEDAGTLVERSELVDGHDIYLGGRRVEFNGNWIHNINDEALLVDGVPSAEVSVHDNVITKSLSAISFGGDTVGGQRWFYRNLIDLREPILGHRRHGVKDKDVWRYGHLLKSNGVDGPYDLFHNTILAANRTSGSATFTHYRSTDGNRRRRSFNNIFVAFNSVPDSGRAVVLLPPPSFRGPTDGNDYFRFGLTTQRPLHVLKYSFGDRTFRGARFADIAQLRSSRYFARSKSQYAPGFENDSILTDPQFMSVRQDGVVDSTDDLRISASSPAAHSGVPLPDDLRDIDDGNPHPEHPAAGRYLADAQPLRVGVDGRLAFPAD